MGKIKFMHTKQDLIMSQEELEERENLCAKST